MKVSAELGRELFQGSAWVVSGIFALVQTLSWFQRGFLPFAIKVSVWSALSQAKIPISLVLFISARNDEAG